mmetsp:Transcript_20243/g.77710  ORF Transcript_20243/g.77710 Transcript_20243/m.77710 type:complete len:267 (-) Transcript_20243:255-1055(-)
MACSVGTASAPWPTRSVLAALASSAAASAPPRASKSSSSPPASETDQRRWRRDAAGLPPSAAAAPLASPAPSLAASARAASASPATGSSPSRPSPLRSSSAATSAMLLTRLLVVPAACAHTKNSSQSTRPSPLVSAVLRTAAASLRTPRLLGRRATCPMRYRARLAVCMNSHSSSASRSPPPSRSNMRNSMAALALGSPRANMQSTMNISYRFARSSASSGAPAWATADRSAREGASAKTLNRKSGSVTNCPPSAGNPVASSTARE